MGMEASIKLTVTLNSGRKLVNDSMCYWRKNWNVVQRIFDILGKNPNEDIEYYKINKGDLQEIKQFLLDCCENSASIEKYDCWSDAGAFICSCYQNAAEIQKIQLLRNKQLQIYDIFPDEFENGYDPDDNIIDITVEFDYSP